MTADRPALEYGEQLLDSAGYVHLSAPITMKPNLIRSEDAIMGFRLDENVPPAPARCLTHEKIRTAAADLVKQADGTAELLRRLNKLVLVCIHLCRSSHH